MENNKMKKRLGVASIVWGVLVLAYEILRNTVLSDLYFNTYAKHLIRHDMENVSKHMQGYEIMNDFIEGLFLIALVVVTILLIVYHRRKSINIFSKKVFSGTDLVCLGTIFCVLIGLNLITVIVVVIGGIVLCKKKVIDK